MAAYGVDSQCQEVLDRIARWPQSELTVANSRALEDRRREEFAGPSQDVFAIREIEIPTNEGTVPAVLYQPEPAQTAGVLVWLHGGGWVVGSPAHCEDQAVALANASGCSVLSVDYRLAPENRFPAALEDAFAAVAWAAEHTDLLGAADRLAIGGDSAGGNIAASVTTMARDCGLRWIDFQLLAYPVTWHDARTDSRLRYAEGYWLTEETMQWFWDQYLVREVDALNPYASPLLASSFAGLPPSFVLLAECDILFDEGLLYAQKLRDAGVAVEVQTYAGMIHGFLACGGVVDRAWHALRTAGRAVGAALRAS